ncbi:hypothetical protein K474DRAFT_375570 [Panus rudis PR-1116 ss-1]|nr:hypothetical protein K474DRAFT_375570 [Panus rudis PR-1116 ss-1]
MSYRGPTQQEIHEIASEVNREFSSCNLSCCFVGGTGCMLYGCSRTPNYDQEVLKSTLVTYGNKFYPRPSQQPGATWQVLYYRLSGDGRAACKVDVLTPGVMNIPIISSDRIVKVSRLPVMPLIPLLLLKLQAWDDHRKSDRSDFQAKGPADVNDVLQSVAICRSQWKRLTHPVACYLSSPFIDAGKIRVMKFMQATRETHGSTFYDWKVLGLC